MLPRWSSHAALNTIQLIPAMLSWSNFSQNFRFTPVQRRSPCSHESIFAVYGIRRAAHAMIPVSQAPMQFAQGCYGMKAPYSIKSCSTVALLQLLRLISGFSYTITTRSYLSSGAPPSLEQDLWGFVQYTISIPARKREGERKKSRHSRSCATRRFEDSIHAKQVPGDSCPRQQKLAGNARSYWLVVSCPS